MVTPGGGALRLAALLEVSPVPGFLLAHEGSGICRGGQVGELASLDGALKPLAGGLTAATGGKLGAIRQDACGEGAVVGIGQRCGVKGLDLEAWGAGWEQPTGGIPVCVPRSLFFFFF